MSASYFWLWPDHVAGKRETHRLREEHNKLAREHHELRIAMDEIHQMVSAKHDLLLGHEELRKRIKDPA